MNIISLTLGRRGLHTTLENRLCKLTELLLNNVESWAKSVWIFLHINREISWYYYYIVQLILGKQKGF